MIDRVYAETRIEKVKVRLHLAKDVYERGGVGEYELCVREAYYAMFAAAALLLALDGEKF